MRLRPFHTPSRRRATLALTGGLAAAATLVPLALTGAAQAEQHRETAKSPFSFAVYGDAPYGTSPTDTSETDATPAFIKAVNADPKVSRVVHVGDIHSGSQYCTQAYDQQIAGLWAGFVDPMVYTPGDNEWTDCHKAKEGGGKYNATTGQVDFVKDAQGNLTNYAGGNPVDNLALVRSIFFPTAGRTLGKNSAKVLSQAQVASPAHPTDRQYVENVVWQQRGFVFATANVPGGSNNDADPWYGAPSASPQQLTEQANRSGAAQRWISRAFSTAKLGRAQGLVLILQADMWDRDGGADNSHLTNYESLISMIAARAKSFGKPVLLLNGDSHTYRSDNPLQQGSACVGDDDVCAYDAWQSHPTYDVPNFHRIVVHGSTTPLEYLRLTITPGATKATSATSFGPFSWTRVMEK